MSIGDRIKDLRKGKGVSQAELAKHIGVSSGNVGDWERGKAKPGSDALIALKNYFDTSSDWILTGIIEDQQKSDNVTLSGELGAISTFEMDLILKLRVLDEDNREEVSEYINMKYSRANRKKQPGKSSTSGNGGTNTAAKKEAV